MRRTFAVIALASLIAVPALEAAARRGPPEDRGERDGWSLMSPAERTEHQQKMQSFTDYDACRAYVAEHHRQMEERAKAQGKTLPPLHEQACWRLKPAGK